MLLLMIHVSIGVPSSAKINTRHLLRALGYATAEAGLAKSVHRHDSVL